MYWYFSTRRAIDCIKQPLATYWNVHFPPRVSEGQRHARSGLQRFEAPSFLPLWPQTLLLQMSLIYYFLLCVSLASRTLLHPALPGNQYPLIGIVIWDDMQASCHECSTPWLTALKGVYPHRRHRGWEAVVISRRPRGPRWELLPCASQNSIFFFVSSLVVLSFPP